MNLFQVTPDIWRGSRPEKLADFVAIRAQFKSVIDLEGGNLYEAEGSTLNLPEIPEPITTAQIVFPFCAPSVDKIEEIARAINSAPKPVFVHCREGRDRTGIAIGAWRSIYGDWTKAEAWAEMKKFGYRYYWNFGLNKTWREL